MRLSLRRRCLVYIVTLPLTKSFLQRLDITQRKWAKFWSQWVGVQPCDTWMPNWLQHCIYIRSASGVMKFSRSSFVYLRVFVHMWIDGLLGKLFGIRSRILVENFSNKPFRRRGRPSLRWDNNLRKFAEFKLQQITWSIPARHAMLWSSFENENS